MVSRREKILAAFDGSDCVCQCASRKPCNGLLAADAQASANQALRVDWNNWAAHYNVALQQISQGNVDYAVAHLTAALVQRPLSGDVQDNLRWSLQQADNMDPTLRRLLYGAWFQRYPGLLSPANWQRLGLLAACLIGGGLCVLVWSIYTTRGRTELRRIGRGVMVTGVALFVASTLSWNAWGELHRPNVALLVEGINLSPDSYRPGQGSRNPADDGGVAHADPVDLPELEAGGIARSAGRQDLRLGPIVVCHAAL